MKEDVVDKDISLTSQEKSLIERFRAARPVGQKNILWFAQKEAMVSINLARDESRSSSRPH